MKFKSMPDYLLPFIEQDKQRARDIRDGKEKTTFAEDRDIAAGLARLDDAGYVVCDYDQLVTTDRKEFIHKTMVVDPLQALIDAAEE